MITIITGTPGAGKTLYTISKLLKPLVGSQIPITDDQGVTTFHERRIYTNINGLLLDHELIDGGENQGLRDWHEWAEPGAVIVFDEVQRIWKPRANGSAVPADIEALETHRHMGVDFILITQNVMLLDRNLLGLCGRHLHIRRIANAHLAIVYEWDHASRQLLYAKSITKSPWRYDRKVFKLYRSALAHTKQKRRLPGLVWFILAGIIGAAYLGPTFFNRLNERAFGVAEASAVAPQAAAAAAPAQDPLSFPDRVPAAAAPASEPEAEPEPEAVAGCARARDVCTCYTDKGRAVDRGPEFCADLTAPARVALDLPEPLVPIGSSELVPASHLDADDHAMLEWATRDRRKPSTRNVITPADLVAAHRIYSPTGTGFKSN